METLRPAEDGDLHDTAATDAPYPATVPHQRRGERWRWRGSRWRVVVNRCVHGARSQATEPVVSAAAGGAVSGAPLRRWTRGWLRRCTRSTRSSVMPAILARPPLSSAALRLVRVSMSQSQHVVDGPELAVGTSLLQCRESTFGGTQRQRAHDAARAAGARRCRASAGSQPAALPRDGRRARGSARARLLRTHRNRTAQI